jgi:F0F1-type ATP synthase membrane subunit b/b'
VRGEKPGENGKEPMIGDRLERPAFAVVRGYDRTQVDAFLAEEASRAVEARTRISELEATVSEFEDLAETSRSDRQRAHELLQSAEADREEAQRKAAEIVEAAHVRAAELYEASRLDRREADELVRHAESERSEAEWRAAEIVAAARAEADDLGEQSRRDREFAGGQVDDARHKIELLVEEARQQVEWFTDEVETKAQEGAAAAMNGSQVHLEEIRQGLDHLEDQRQTVIGDLSRLREELDGLAAGMLRAG